MMEKIYTEAVVLANDVISEGIYSMLIKSREIAGHARPGQFVNVYCRDKSRMLPRPISICDVDTAEYFRIVFRIAGTGTEEFSKYQPGDKIKLAGPLGNGFPITEAFRKKVLLLGGGIGIPPMLYLVKKLKEESLVSKVTVVNGYRNDMLFLNEEFVKNSKIYIATEDGSAGTKGNVLDAVKQNDIDADIIYACGPMPMLRAIKAYAVQNGITAYVSLEERMACGIGACLACVCKSTDKDEHTNVKNKRICKEGPVFNVNDIEL